ncbi:MAG: aspartate ammonia-lyase [Succinivibrionaceae bacterium]|nr:aspartate ammonia-lyase [Succinivibrionaceae bacterium]
MATRKEHDFIGELEIPDNVYYGVQTFRAVDNFKITGHRYGDYPDFVRGFAYIKKAAALANKEVKVLEPAIADALAAACDRVLAGEFADQFVVDMIQGGAGTSTNMNTNEVLVNIALEATGHHKGEYQYIHPNDHANLGQSTNDTYPSSIKVAAVMMMDRLLAAMQNLIGALDEKAKACEGMIKMGRTELEDAVPTTLGNTFHAFASFIREDLKGIAAAQDLLRTLNMGATAIGTGINCHPDYKNVVIRILNEITHGSYRNAEDMIAATQDTADYVSASAALRTLAVHVNKIANDLRWMNSGPRCGLGEIELPKMQPGSSIMPGKVNPVIPEVVLISCYQTMGNDLTVTLCAQRGEFELNGVEPGIAYALFNSIRIMTNAINTLADKAVKNLRPLPEACLKSVLGSVGIVTAFNPYLGYEKSASIAKEALETGKAVGDICLERGYMSKEEIDKILNPANMLNPSMVRG